MMEEDTTNTVGSVALTKGQIEMADTIIDEEHPIFYAKIEQAFPYLCCLAGTFRNCCASSDDSENKSKQLK